MLPWKILLALILSYRLHSRSVEGPSKTIIAGCSQWALYFYVTDVILLQSWKRFFENTGPGHAIAGAQVGEGAGVGVGLQPATSQAFSFPWGSQGSWQSLWRGSGAVFPRMGNAVIRLCFLLTDVSPSALCPLNGGGVGNFVLRVEVGEVPG